jgi:pyrroloquinoline quinone (PQQ) biosynthesis protein C
MAEIGANTEPITKFLQSVEKDGIDFALVDSWIPEPSEKFMRNTFDIIQRGKVHEIAAAFTYGRETVIPAMFRRLANQLNINAVEAPRFNYYLERHVEVDKDDHGPFALKLMEELCENHPLKIVEAENTAVKSIQARIEFWSQVENAILVDQ